MVNVIPIKLIGGIILDGMVGCGIQRRHIRDFRLSSHWTNNRLLGKPNNIQRMESENVGS